MLLHRWAKSLPPVGLRLPVASNQPLHQTLRVVMLHGFLAHSGTFSSFVRELTRCLPHCADEKMRHSPTAATGTEMRLVVDLELLDARNHGRSPHSPTHHLDDLVEDLQHCLRSPAAASPSTIDHGVEVRPPLLLALGHSMGSHTWGKLLMDHPVKEVIGLVSLDMPPLPAEAIGGELLLELREMLHHMHMVDLQRIHSASTAHEEFLRVGMADVRVRGFCTTNLILPTADHGARWRCNVEVLQHALAERSFFLRRGWCDAHEGIQALTTPVLSILGANSPVGRVHQGRWAKFATHVEEHVMGKCDHVLHYDAPRPTAELVARFLLQCVHQHYSQLEQL